MTSTVLGPVSPGDLGTTLMHEHLVFGFPGFEGDITLGIPREDAILRAKAEVEKAKAFGVKTIVDATPNECGRDPELLKEVSERTEVNIICSTGYYFEGAGSPAYFKFRAGNGYDIAEEVYDMMMKEISDGIAKTGVKPGVIKLGSSHGVITEYEAAFFRAAARVQKETGTVIITHTQGGTMGHEQADLLLSEGGIAKKIVIGHMCGNLDVQYHIDLLKKGVYDAFDRFGQEGFGGSPLDSERITVLLELLRLGFTDRLFIAQDTVNVLLGRPMVFPPEVKEVMDKANIIRIFEVIIPRLIEKGIGDAEINMMLEKNVKCLFS